MSALADLKMPTECQHCSTPDGLRWDYYDEPGEMSLAFFELNCRNCDANIAELTLDDLRPVLQEELQRRIQMANVIDVVVATGNHFTDAKGEE